MNVPVLRFVPVLVLALLLALPAPVPAAEPFGEGSTPSRSPGITPEQAEAARQILKSDPEARKALDDALLKKNGEEEGEAAKREPAAGKAEAEGVAARAALIAAESRYDWTKSTYVGGLFGKRLTRRERETLVHFGHDLFDRSAGAPPPLENMPVSKGYVVGPGDEIVVRLWGRVEGTQRVTVDREGKIFFPKYGSLHVAGKTFGELEAFLKSKISTIAEVSSDVGMGKMKGIRVSVMGEVRFPGWYNMSSLHTAIQALSSAGRVKDIGSLRGIRIQRGGKTAAEVDLYDFLLKGDSRTDIRLLQGDVVFVPVVGKLAAVAGEVRRPAIYELKGEETLLDLVRLSGGFTPAAYKRRVQVER
ncbi:MAG: polysaccharide export protein, partial [Deltaproteobacteria bacterium]|nr:polysaccharide export protein [Deltaproteobacteria bacterium]